MSDKETKLKCWWCGQPTIPARGNNGDYPDGQKLNCPLCGVKVEIRRFKKEGKVAALATTDPWTTGW